MPTTPKMKQIEKERGKPIQDVLQDLYAEFNNPVEVARNLGISRAQLYVWLAMLNLETKTVLRIRREDHA